MNRFVAYRHTGADPERLAELLAPIREAFAQRGEKTYCTYFDEGDFKSAGHKRRNVMEHAFKKIEEMGSLFVVLDGEEKSEGMLMEVGYCIAKDLPIVVAKRRGVNSTYLPEMANSSFEYNDVNDLTTQIGELPRD